MTRSAFGEAAHPRAAIRREGLPKPQELASRGLTTKESLEWLASHDPKPPAPEHHIDNPDLRREATDAARANHRATIEKLRGSFRDRSAKGREDFGTAQSYQRPERER